MPTGRATGPLISSHVAPSWRVLMGGLNIDRKYDVRGTYILNYTREATAQFSILVLMSSSD